MHRRGGWVAVAAVGLATCGACVDRADDVGEASRTGGERTAVVELLTTSRHTVSALQDERSLATLSILGVEDAVATPLGDEARARRLTDEATARFESAVSEHGRQGETYQPALGGLGEVDELRREIDARQEPPAVDQVDDARAIDGRYSEVLAALNDANTTLAATIDDPDVRRGAELYDQALRQTVLGGQLVSTLLMTAVISESGMDQPEEIAEVSELYGSVVSGRAFVDERAAGSEYEPAARALDAELDAVGYLDAVPPALETGTVDIAGLIESVDVPDGQGWRAFLDRVEQILAG